ncbi:hypothetical protein CTZ27_35740 [Streptomyces griseocarneus]|nr:hypothetical protein CTZ27_35740 [Streptomyces griseocarneus]
MTAYDVPPSDPNQVYDITVGRITVNPPLDPENARYESFVGRALEADSSFFEDGEPSMPEPPAPVVLACQHPQGDGVCASTQLRVRGTWNTPAAIICENGHTWQGTVEMMRSAISILRRTS